MSAGDLRPRRSVPGDPRVGVGRRESVTNEAPTVGGPPPNSMMPRARRARTTDPSHRVPDTFDDVMIRPATPDDLDAVVALRLALLHEHRDNPIYGRLRHDAPARARRLFAQQLESAHEIILLADRRGEAIGILRCVHSGGAPLLLPNAYGYLASVYVRPEARRSGVLRQLLDAAETWCRNRGLTELRLHNAADSETSNAVWDALGFEIVEHLRIRPLQH